MPIGEPRSSVRTTGSDERGPAISERGFGGMASGARRQKHFTRAMQNALEAVLGPHVAQEEASTISQDTDRNRVWARRLAESAGMHLKRAVGLEKDMWRCAAKGTIQRWFDEFVGAVADAAVSAIVPLNASHAFSAAGLVPFGDSQEDVERQEEARSPDTLHTGSRVLTSPSFLGQLIGMLAPEEIAEATRRRMRLEDVTGPMEAGIRHGRARTCRG